MIKATGSTQREAIAIFQLKKNSMRAVMVVAITEPISSGIQWEEAVSKSGAVIHNGVGQIGQITLPKEG